MNTNLLILLTCLQPLLETYHLQNKIQTPSMPLRTWPLIFPKLIYHLLISAPTRCPELLRSHSVLVPGISGPCPHCALPSPFTTTSPSFFKLSSKVMSYMEPSLNPFPRLGHGLCLCASLAELALIKQM